MSTEGRLAVSRWSGEGKVGNAHAQVSVTNRGRQSEGERGRVKSTGAVHSGPGLVRWMVSPETAALRCLRERHLQAVWSSGLFPGSDRFGLVPFVCAWTGWSRRTFVLRRRAILPSLARFSAGQDAAGG